MLAMAATAVITVPAIYTFHGSLWIALIAVVIVGYSRNPDHLRRVVIVSFNAIAIQDVQGISLVDISQADFTAPIVTGTTTHFLTARAAVRRMVEKGSGVILTLSASAAVSPATTN